MTLSDKTSEKQKNPAMLKAVDLSTQADMLATVAGVVGASAIQILIPEITEVVVPS